MLANATRSAPPAPRTLAGEEDEGGSKRRESGGGAGEEVDSITRAEQQLRQARRALTLYRGALEKAQARRLAGWRGPACCSTALRHRGGHVLRLPALSTTPSSPLNAPHKLTSLPSACPPAGRARRRQGAV